MKVREIRTKLGLNQSTFWKRLNVTQSGGSRYEAGRKMPKAVQALLQLVYTTTDKQAAAMLTRMRKQ